MDFIKLKTAQLNGELTVYLLLSYHVLYLGKTTLAFLLNFESQIEKEILHFHYSKHFIKLYKQPNLHFKASPREYCRSWTSSDWRFYAGTLLGFSCISKTYFHPWNPEIWTIFHLTLNHYFHWNEKISVLVTLWIGHLTSFDFLHLWNIICLLQNAVNS